jgi:nucleotide-diphospho-sugar transferase
MKIYTCYTPTHQLLLQKYFLPSLKDQFEVVIKELPSLGPLEDHRYKTETFIKAVLHKTYLIIKAVEENQNKLFIFSDCDVQFFRPMESDLVRLIGDSDIIFQRNSPKPDICTGFFMCRGNQKILDFWSEVANIIKNSELKDDQDITNDILGNEPRKAIAEKVIFLRLWFKILRFINLDFFMYSGANNRFKIKWRYLPVEFFCGGTLNGMEWNQGTPLQLPQNIIMHHANWTIGVDNKIKQLDYVRSLVLGDKALSENL